MLKSSSRGTTQRQVRRFPGNAAADEQERDEERPRGQVVSERHAAQSVDVAHTQTHTGKQKSPSLVPARHQMAHLFGPSAQQDAQLAVPTDRWPSSTQVPWQAGGQAAASPRRRSNSHISLVSLCYHPKKKRPPVNPTDQELSQSKTVPCVVGNSPTSYPRPSPLARCLSLVAVRGPGRGLQDGGCRLFYLQWGNWRNKSS